MPDELVFTVHGSTAVAAMALSLAEAGLRECQDLQEWVIGHPEIIGPDILIVTMEFDRWQSPAWRSADRLDILGVHASGYYEGADPKGIQGFNMQPGERRTYARSPESGGPATPAAQRAQGGAMRGYSQRMRSICGLG